MKDAIWRGSACAINSGAGIEVIRSGLSVQTKTFQVWLAAAWACVVMGQTLMA